jgi:hypothetical protein
VSLGFNATAGASVEADGGGAVGLQFDAVASARPIGSLYLRSWGLQVGDGDE